MADEIPTVPMTHAEATQAYYALAPQFGEINRRYNQAVRDGALSDALELEFMRAQKFMKAAYRKQAQIAIAEKEQD